MQHPGVSCWAGWVLLVFADTASHIGTCSLSEELGGADDCFWISKLQPLLKTHRAPTVMRLRPRGLGSLGSTTCPGGRQGTRLHGSLDLGVSDLETDLNTCSSLSKCVNLTRVSNSLCLSRCFHEMRLRYDIIVE